MAKSEYRLDWELDTAQDAWTVQVKADGKPLATRIYPIADLGPEVMAYAARHGVKQKIGDSAGLQRSDYGGKSPPWQDKVAAMDETWAQIVAGQWDKGAGAGDTMDRQVLRMALSELSDEAESEIAEAVEQLTAAEVRVALFNEQVRPVADKIRAGMAKPEVVQSAIAKLNKFGFGL